jgi:hypothetical protein
VAHGTPYLSNYCRFAVDIVGGLADGASNSDPLCAPLCVQLTVAMSCRGQIRVGRFCVVASTGKVENSPPNLSGHLDGPVICAVKRLNLFSVS